MSALQLVGVMWTGATFCWPAESDHAQAPQGERHEYLVSGTVTNSVTHRTIGQTEVRIYSRFPFEFEETVLTDRNGKFRLEKVPEGQFYLLRIRKPGFFDKADLESDDEHSAPDFVVGPNTKAVELSLTPGGKIEGNITDEGGQAIEGLSLEVLKEQVTDDKHDLIPWGGDFTTTKTGHFEIGYLRPGTYVVRTKEQDVYYPIGSLLERPKYLSQTSKPVMVLAGQEAHISIRVASGHGSEDHACQCPKADRRPVPIPAADAKYKLAGTVVLSNSTRPLSGVIVTISSIPDYHFTATQVTKADGKFAFQNLAPGVYRLEGQRRDILAQAYEQKEGRMRDFVVGPSSNTERITFRLHPRGGITGAVLDEDGEAVEYADVALFRRTEGGNVQLSTQPPTPFARTDALGHFYFGYLESGSYLLAVKARPRYGEVCPLQVANAEPCAPGGPADVAYPVTYSGSSTDEATAVSIAVHEGVLAYTRVILRAVPAAHPQFTLPMHHSRQTPPEIELKASEFGTYKSGGLIYAPSAWADDHLSIGGLAPGRYLVRLRNEPSCQGETSIHVTGNQTFELNCKANAAQQ